MIAAVAVLATAAQAQGPARPAGYLPAGALDSLALVPAPPATGSAAEAADAAAFRDSRKLEGSARWKQAIAEDRIFPPAGMGHFHCALGAKVDEKNAPVLTTLMTRVVMDAVAVADPVKKKYARIRPSVSDTASTICLPRGQNDAASGSYPSSHAVAGWSWGLILAELAPDRATELLRKGREFGENRAICGVHYPSDIDAGRILGSSMVARLHAEPAFRADLDKARAEVAAARTAAPASGCAA
jgi:acid phosphatase (class A)